jgi:CBS domain-containing protein
MTTTTTGSRAKTVGELMVADPVRVGGGTTAAELAVILEENCISGVPVVDPQDRVIGVVSRTDLLGRCVEGPLGSRPGSFLSSIGEGLGGEIDTESLGTVSEFMNTDPVTARRKDLAANVARRMVDERVHRVIIVDDGLHPVGIVTTLDLLKLVAT